jgi:hypothetical protein
MRAPSDSADDLFGLQPSLSGGGVIEARGPGVWRLGLPAGAGAYRLAQLDDYRGRGREDFPHRSPFRLQLRARCSAAEIPGTWGFGLWNDPFSMGVGGAGPRLRLPALPNTAWFFFASRANYLSLRDDLPAAGGLAGTFRSPRLHPLLMAPGAAALPLLALPLAARWLRRMARPVVRQSAVDLRHDACAWHTYHLDWQADRARFLVDGSLVLETPLAPRGPLGVVIWIDNQYMALPPDGRMRFGVLDSRVEHWVEIADIDLSSSPEDG